MKISIIMVTYNCKQTIERAMLSAFNQDYDDFEFIIIDGASTDGTTEIIDRYKDELSYYVSEKDDGIYYAMNKGIKASKGEYVYFLNADDRLADGALKRIASYMQYTDADIVFGDVLYGKNGKYRTYTNYPLEAIQWVMPICHQAVFMKRDNGYFDTDYRIAADYKKLNEIYNQDKRFMYVPCLIAIVDEGGKSGDWHATGMEMVDIACKACIKYVQKSRLTTEIIVDRYIDIVNRYLFFNGFNQNKIIDFCRRIIVYKDNVFVWGTGKISRELWGMLSNSRIRISGVIDNAFDKKGTLFNGVSIDLPERLAFERNCTVLVLSEKYCDEIIMQINEMKLDISVQVLGFTELNRQYLSDKRAELVKICKENNKAFAELLSVYGM